MRLRYWFRTGLRSLGVLLGASLLYTVLMAQEMRDLWGHFTNIPTIYLLQFGTMMNLGMCLSLYRFNVPLALSFGSTRGETLLGLQICRLLPTLAVTAILVILALLTGENGVSALIALSLGLLLGAAAIGSILGILYTKWGKLSLVITVAVVLLVFIGIGFLSASFLGGWTLGLLSTRSLSWLALGIGLLLYSLLLIPESRLVWKCNVKL